MHHFQGVYTWPSWDSSDDLLCRFCLDAKSVRKPEQDEDHSGRRDWCSVISRTPSSAWVQVPWQCSLCMRASYPSSFSMTRTSLPPKRAQGQTGNLKSKWSPGKGSGLESRKQAHLQVGAVGSVHSGLKGPLFQEQSEKADQKRWKPLPALHCVWFYGYGYYSFTLALIKTHHVYASGQRAHIHYLPRHNSLSVK